jgi:formamidopyrimidine-DNA glycosylase
MPELPEITVYVEALDRRVVGNALDKVRLRSVSLLKTWDPPLSAADGRKVLGVRRLGKRIVFELEGGLFLVLHLMLTGRLRWKKPGASLPRKGVHAAFDFPNGSLFLSEAGTQKRASLHLVQGDNGLAALNPGGVEPLEASREEFETALRQENHTLKRALTDPRLLSGIGNAHSDEILLEAELSPLKRTGQLTDKEVDRLYRAVRRSLIEWTDRLRAEVGQGFPEKVTAFHPAMGAHGKFGKPCPRCGTKIQRIVRGAHETNYGPRCQTGGRLLKDRALSKLLREDWPTTVEEMEGL